MSNIFKIFSFTGKFWKWYLFMGFFIIAMSLSSLVSPILMKQIVDVIVKGTGGNEENLRLIIIYLVLIILSDVSITSFSAFATWIGDMLSVKLNSFLSEKFYRHLLGLDIGFYDNEITGKITNKMYRGIDSITDFIKSSLNNFLPFFLTALITIIMLSFYSPVIAILLALLFPTYILISHNSTKAWSAHEGEKNRIADLSQGRVFESISGIRVVKAFAAELTELTAFIISRSQIEKITKTQTKQWHWYDFLRRFALNVILFAILCYIVYFTYKGRFTLGEMTLLLQLVNQARFPLFAMSFILGQIQQANAGSKDFFALLDTPSKISDSKNAVNMTIPDNNKEAVKFQNIYFRYDQAKQVLSDISFSLNKNEKMALVGESGQGKSTLVNLMLRFYVPEKGQIYMFGQNISDVTLESLRNNIAVVFQESLLFSGTILENIRYAKPQATIDEVIDVAKAANAHEFIKEFPDKYDSIIGERGVKLSGGQKQRIAIARAMLKNAPVLILDEATSSLDSRSELLVQEGLERLMKNRTTIIIAHRLSTIADADKIIVLSKGVIAQYGKPSELLKIKNGIYSRMINLQQKLLSATPLEKAEALRQFDLVA